MKHITLKDFEHVFFGMDEPFDDNMGAIVDSLNRSMTIDGGTFKLKCTGSMVNIRFSRRTFDMALGEEVEYVYSTLGIQRKRNNKEIIGIPRDAEVEFELFPMDAEELHTLITSLISL